MASLAEKNNSNTPQWEMIRRLWTTWQEPPPKPRRTMRYMGEIMRLGGTKKTSPCEFAYKGALLAPDVARSK